MKVCFFKFFFFLFLSFEFALNQNGVLILPFKKELPNLKDTSPNNVIYPKMIDNLIMTELRIGTEPQTIKLKIELESYLFYIAGQNSKNKIKFDEGQSNTYKQIENKNLSFQVSNINEGVFSSDYIYFNQNSKEKYNTNFLLAIDTTIDESGGLIGFNMEESLTISYSQFNFMNELKRIGLIKDNYFTINYVDNNSGNIIIGDLPHNIDNKYKEKYFKDTYSKLENYDLTWNLKIDNIFIADKNNSNDKINVGESISAYLRVEKNIIEGTERYRKILLSSFMSEYIGKKLCFEVNTQYYFTYYCKKEVDISKLKNIYFYSNDLDFTFELTYKDLFYYNENDGNNYFLIIFNNNLDDDTDYLNYYVWILGEPIFKKYQFVFNKDTKRLGIYKFYDDTSDGNSSEEGKGWFARNKWYLIMIILLLILLTGLSVMVYKYLKNMPKRKKKANELIDDEYEYNGEKNNIN